MPKSILGEICFKKTPKKKNFVDKLKDKFTLIFDAFLKDLEVENYESPIFIDHVEYIDDENYNTYFKPLKKNHKLTLIVRDYIAGMSDKYFNEIFEKYQKISKQTN
ncbi:unnamed protein product [marine sediment metagenome]|uniref:Fanconi anemia core complex-associated protein 24 pseudonuclease domain-containing protein n=1 Tax=marine sediment metagenome TaxID=412755 RepID=X1G7X0_9ZZZZ